MAKPTLSPASTTSTVILTSTGSIAATGNGAANSSHYPFGLYSDAESDLYDANFIKGASDQVAYTYKKLGGDVLDIELTVGNIYASYEEAVLEYSYQINIHQAKNVLSDLLGMSTGTFDHDGQMIGGDAKDSAANLSYPRFEFRYARRIGEGVSKEAGVGGNLTMFSASFRVAGNQQDYDLQTIIADSANGTDHATGKIPLYADKFKNKSHGNKITIRQVFFKTPAAVWRFYGYYGGLNVVGNLNYYGQYADDTTFELIPAWHNKLQAMAYEDHMWTRLSHYSYELHNNKLRLYPTPNGGFPSYMWVNFTIDTDGWEQDSDRRFGAKGINNMNTLPFENIPYQNINSIGKQWIRRYTLALSKEVLGHIRGKFGSIPIPGESVTLNSSELLGQASQEQNSLKEELKTILDEMTYKSLAEKDAAMMQATSTVLEDVPLLIYQG
jgi:hypothetical protein|tara:strand:- start:1438 stop:2760 length:1323 start_codon:yes stop_codon:yes gene_type:complete